MFHIPCKNCAGRGYIEKYKHVESGICFKCNGSGVQEATKGEYEAYQRQLERKKQGKYILFNKGNVEFYKTEKEINKKYGNFFCGDNGYTSYKDENIAYTIYDEDYKEFIQVVNKEYIGKIQKKIDHYKKMLEKETDSQWIEMLTAKINDLKKV